MTYRQKYYMEHGKEPDVKRECPFMGIYCDECPIDDSDLNNDCWDREVIEDEGDV